MSKIDRNRGAHIRNHPSGGQIAMYIDSPGEYVDARGMPATVDQAREAGFDVEQLEKDRKKVAKRREFERKLAAERDDDDDSAAPNVTVVDGAQLAGLSIVKTGSRSFNVVDPNGKVINKKPLSKTAAQDLIDLIGDTAEEGDDESAEEDASDLVE